MSDGIATIGPLSSTSNCGVCARPLVYGTEPRAMKCSICGQANSTLIFCPEGHFVCDSCHSKAAVDVLLRVLADTTSSDPMAILEKVMAHPSVPMHGPEHHGMVPAVLVAAARNAGYPVPEGAVTRALERGTKVPGGWCGACGDCGAAVGVGIAVSVITLATPLTGKARTLAMGATSAALSQMLDEYPRCCKRASRTAIEAAIDYFSDKLDISLPKGEKPRCAYMRRNQECVSKQCRYYPGE